jgi:hypothetical protein
MDDIAADNVNKNSSDKESVNSYLEEFHHWTEYNTKTFCFITISKKYFGLVWIADAKKQELTFLKLHPYKSIKFPHLQEHIGILTTFARFTIIQTFVIIAQDLRSYSFTRIHYKWRLT